MRQSRAIPSNITNLMDPKDRKALGVQTIPELAEAHANKLEKDLRSDVLAYLSRHSYLVGTAATNRRSTYTVGWPDLTVIAPCGYVVFLELKASWGRLSEEQKRIIQTLKDNGHTVLVISSYPQFIEEMKKLNL